MLSSEMRLKAARSWLFVPGADEAAQHDASTSAADVAILELEDFTTPAERPTARKHLPDVIRAWHRAGKLAAVRINPLDGAHAAEGIADLQATFAAGNDPAAVPDVILMPKVARPDQVQNLARHVARLSFQAGRSVTASRPGGIPLVPNIENAAGLLATRRILSAHRSVLGGLVASEDMAADLGGIRGRDGQELIHARAQFHLACTAVGLLSIDCPYTWQDVAGLEAETSTARRLGYTAKGAVLPQHCTHINQVMTPDATAVALAERQVAAFEAARAAGDGTIAVDGVMVELPIYLGAKRLLDRASILSELHPDPA